MASASSEQLHQEPLADFIAVRTDEVDEGERLRPVDPVWAGALGALMLRDGQETPLQVCRLPGRNRWTLVAGGHRLAGARVAGIEHLKAEVVSANRDSRRLREVNENLWRRDLQPIDRAAFIAELVQLKRAQAGLDEVAHREGSLHRTIKAEAAGTLETISNVYGWSDEVGEQLGLTGRTIRNDLLLYRGLSASIVERLRAARHPALGNASQLRALAKLAPDQQRRVVDLLTLPGASLGYGQPRTVTDAIAHQLGPKPAKASDPETKRLSAFIGAYSRMSLSEKKGALAQLQGLLPAGTTLTNVEQMQVKATFSPEHARYREEALASIDEAREVIDGIVEDDVLPGDRGSDLRRVSTGLQLTRFTICCNGFDMEPRS